MLPVINLDDEGFQEIFEEARQMIFGLYPGWTDYNEHDPGITFLELFSWLKEMQHYHMNQIGREHDLVYLKLLGMQQLQRAPAKVLLQVTDHEQDFLLPKGSKLYAGDICFETSEAVWLTKQRILSCFFMQKENKVKVDERILSSEVDLRFYPFGESPEAGDEFYLQFERSLLENKIHSIYFKIFEDYPVKRNTIRREEWIPLASMSVAYYTSQGWTECEQIMDETCQFLRSGKLYVQLKNEHISWEGGYYLRFKLLDSNYEIAPIILKATFNTVTAEQTDTLSEYRDYLMEQKEDGQNDLELDSFLGERGCQEVYIREKSGFCMTEAYSKSKDQGRTVLKFQDLFRGRSENQLLLRIVNYQAEFALQRSFEATGFPYQMFEVTQEQTAVDRLSILIEDEMTPGYYQEWERVDNFSSSTEVDRHYVYDDRKGRICFGDGEHGRIPEGKGILIGYSVTLGQGGNVKAGQVSRTRDDRIKFAVTNPECAASGRDKENIDACYLRFNKEYRQIKRAVTDEDYEQLIKETPGLMIESVKVLPLAAMRLRDEDAWGNTVNVVVKPFSDKRMAALNSAYLVNIKKFLEGKRLIGTKINLLSPEYSGISFFAEIVIKPDYLRAEEQIKTAVEEFFQKSEVDFGRPIRYSELYGSIDELDCVLQIMNLTIATQGKGVTRNVNGDLILPANGLAYLKDTQYNIYEAE